MNAKEAREKSLKIEGQAEKEQYSAIKAVISMAVNNGELSVHTYTPLSPSIKRKLEEEGYTVNSYFDQRDGTTNTISWSLKQYKAVCNIDKYEGNGMEKYTLFIKSAEDEEEAFNFAKVYMLSEFPKWGFFGVDLLKEI